MYGNAQGVIDKRKREPLFGSGSLFGQGLRGFSDFSRANSERILPAEELLKGHATPNPIAREAGLQVYEPTKDWLAHARKKARDELYRVQGDEGRKLMEETELREKVDGLEQEQRENFYHDYVNWLAGQGRADDYTNSGLNPANFGQGKLISRHPAVIDFLEQKINRQAAYLSEIAKMKVRGSGVSRHGGPSTPEETWLFYKYITRGQKEIDKGDFWWIDDEGGEPAGSQNGFVLDPNKQVPLPQRPNNRDKAAGAYMGIARRIVNGGGGGALPVTVTEADIEEARRKKEEKERLKEEAAKKAEAERITSEKRAEEHRKNEEARRVAKEAEKLEKEKNRKIQLEAKKEEDARRIAVELIKKRDEDELNARRKEAAAEEAAHAEREALRATAADIAAIENRARANQVEFQKQEQRLLAADRELSEKAATLLLQHNAAMAQQAQAAYALQLADTAHRNALTHAYTVAIQQVRELEAAARAAIVEDMAVDEAPVPAIEVFAEAASELSPYLRPDELMAEPPAAASPRRTELSVFVAPDEKMADIPAAAASKPTAPFKPRPSAASEKLKRKEAEPPTPGKAAPAPKATVETLAIKKPRADLDSNHEWLRKLVSGEDKSEDTKHAVHLLTVGKLLPWLEKLADATNLSDVPDLPPGRSKQILRLLYNGQGYFGRGAGALPGALKEKIQKWFNFVRPELKADIIGDEGIRRVDNGGLL